jgi:phosphate/phosphite/phosphonate ABC transporter binding protein
MVLMTGEPRMNSNSKWFSAQTSQKGEIRMEIVLGIPDRPGWLQGFYPFAQYLAEKTGNEVKLLGFEDEQMLKDKLGCGNLNLAILTSTAYASAKGDYPALQYIGTGQTMDEGQARSFYFGFIVTVASSRITNLREARGKKIGYVSISSSSGYNYPRAYLRNQFIDPDSFFGSSLFLNSHDNVVAAVHDGAVDVGVTWDLSLLKGKQKYGDVFRVLDKYGPIVNHALVAHQSLNADDIRIVREAITSLPDEVKTQPGFPYTAIEILSDRDYEFARLVMEQNEQLGISRRITLFDFRRSGVLLALDQINAIRVSKQSEVSSEFISREPTLLMRDRTLSEMYDDAERQMADLKAKYPDVVVKVDAIAKQLGIIADTTTDGTSVLTAHRELLQLDSLHGKNELFTVSCGSDYIEIDASTEEYNQRGEWLYSNKEDKLNREFLSSISVMLQNRRRNKQRPGIEEQIAVAAGYRLLESGVTLAPAYKSISAPGFGSKQPLLYSTDPGDDHIRVTSVDSGLMNGVVVHIEHIDREGEANKELVEPYRLPATINAAKVRLHVGTEAPCSAFIGRPVFESNSFLRDLLKTAHMTASACTAMFNHGIVDCKVAVEKMTAAQAVDFMKCVSGNALRDRYRQLLSAAFNINTPLVDDRAKTKARYGGHAVLIEDKREIARLGIELAEAGGFDKVTWDGASNTTSIPIVEQLDHAELLELVHKAHELGLITYISAGLEPKHMRDAAYLGLDGVGIGNSLHYLKIVDGKIKAVGAFKPENILRAITTRDEALKEPLGIGAWLLARLDRLFFEKSLPDSNKNNELRQALFVALQMKDERAVIELIKQLDDIRSFPEETDHPIIERAYRRRRAEETRRVAGFQFTESRICALVDRRDISQLAELLEV